MQNDKQLYLSSSPHVKNNNTTRKIMLNVCLALLPAYVMSIVYFGINAFLLVVVSCISAVLSEFIYLLIAKKSIREIVVKFDCSSIVTGMLVGLSCGAQYPLYIPALGSAFAIIVVKMLFGGTGKNIVNPAITGRIFIFMSFTATMTFGWLTPAVSSVTGAPVITGATILTGNSEIGGILDGNLLNVSILDMFLGTGITGCLGETCKLALIVGGIYLAIRKIINIGYPIIYVLVTGLFTVILNGFNFNYFLPSILSGGLIMGAIFMATDYTTTPNTTLGNVIYFALLGLLTAGLRQATGYEVVSFVILFMNLLVPQIDKFIINIPFGYKKAKKVKGE